MFCKCSSYQLDLVGCDCEASRVEQIAIASTPTAAPAPMAPSNLQKVQTAVPSPATPREIVVAYSSVDHFRKRRTFKTVAGASRYAREWIGDHPSIGMGYAVSDDGVGKITVRGATLAELFPERA
jgi:hypothetical protein